MHEPRACGPLTRLEAEPPAGAAEAVASAPPLDDRWRLEDIYPGEEAFRRHLDEVQALLPSLEAFRGRLGDSPAALADALDVLFDLSKQFYRLHGFASMQSDEDTQVARNQARKQEVEMLWTEYSRATSWVRPELLELGDALIEWPATEPRLVPYDQYLKDLRRSAPHVLSPPEERILAEAGLLTGGAGSLYALFQNAELPRPEVTLSTGETVRLTSAEFAKHRTSGVRDDRRLVFTRYFEAYRSFRATLGANLDQAVKSHVFLARSRHHGSSLAAALHGENIPEAVYHNLIERVREALPTLHRYLGLRARALRVQPLAYFDLHCPLVPEASGAFDVGRAKALVTDAMRPLGERYVEALRCALGERWIDWHPRPGKRSGAYSTGAAYDVHPFILLNFNGDFESVATLTHELGHAMHSHFSNSRQPFSKAHYSIFNAEVASTFNEALLLDRCLDEASSRAEKIELATHALDGWRGTLFRQTQFAEFELEIHRRVESGIPLTGEALDELYVEQLRQYLGHRDDTLHVDDAWAIEWAGVPHFYYDFYVYQYATGIVAATALSQSVLAGDVRARDRYLAFLESGGSADSLDLLKSAGVDLTTPDPYRTTFAAMESMLDRLESWLDEEEDEARDQIR